jgi:hypothetical protein
VTESTPSGKPTRAAWPRVTPVKPGARPTTSDRPCLNCSRPSRPRCDQTNGARMTANSSPTPATWLRQERWDDELKVTLPGVVAGKEWHETWPGIVYKGVQMGIKEQDYAHPQEFKAAVLRSAMRAA